MNDYDKLISIYTCGDNVEASIIRDILENAGIACMLTNETFSSIYPIGHTSLGGIQVLVFEREAERAKQVIEEQQKE